MTPPIVAGVPPALDREAAVRDLVARYADAVNGGHEAAWASTWADDGVWQLGATRIEGRHRIVETWRTAMSRYDHVIQLVSHGSVDTSPDSGTGRWTIWELGAQAGSGTLVVGCYLDRYVRRDGAWRFSERRFTVTYRGGIPEGTFSPFPN